MRSSLAAADSRTEPPAGERGSSPESLQFRVANVLARVARGSNVSHIEGDSPGRTRCETSFAELSSSFNPNSVAARR